MQGEDYFNRLKKKVFIFDEKSDCLVWNGYAFIQSITDFQRIFRYFEALQAKAAETIKLVTPRLPILNLSDFTAACLNNPIMLSKLAQISKKEYLASMTMDDIKQTIGLQTPLQNQDRWERREVGLREKPLKEMDHSETTRRRLPWINNDEAEICILIENPDVAHITR